MNTCLKVAYLFALTIYAGLAHGGANNATLFLANTSDNKTRLISPIIWTEMAYYTNSVTAWTKRTIALPTASASSRTPSITVQPAQTSRQLRSPARRSLWMMSASLRTNRR